MFFGFLTGCLGPGLCPGDSRVPGRGHAPAWWQLGPSGFVLKLCKWNLGAQFVTTSTTSCPLTLSWVIWACRAVKYF